jgi:hypothetical protein
MRMEVSLGKSRGGGAQSALDSTPEPIVDASAFRAAAIPRYHGSTDRSSAGRHNQTRQAILHVDPKRNIECELCRLGAQRSAIGMPLRDNRPILKAASAPGGISAQFPRNRRGVAFELTSDLADSEILGSQECNLFAFVEGQVAARRRRRRR